MHKIRAKASKLPALGALSTAKLRTVRGGDDTQADTQSNGTINIGTHPPGQP
jgi:hypothetical protein